MRYNFDVPVHGLKSTDKQVILTIDKTNEKFNYSGIIFITSTTNTLKYVLLDYCFSTKEFTD